MSNHKCERQTASYQAGYSVDYCEEDDEGFLWIGIGNSGAFETMVNYCPFCGFKSPQKAVGQDQWEQIKEWRNNA